MSARERWAPPPVVTLNTLDTLIRRLAVRLGGDKGQEVGRCWCGEAEVTPMLSNGLTASGWCARCLPLALEAAGLAVQG